MLQVSRTSWHSRIYSHWYKTKYNFSPRESTSLCPYMRVIMFWAPIRFFLGNGCLFGEIGDFPVYLSMWIYIASLYVVPTALGYISYQFKLALFTAEMVIVLIALAVCLSALLVIGLKKTVNSPWLNNLVASTKKTTTNTGFYQLLREYIRSGHDMVCPTIQFKD